MFDLFEGSFVNLLLQPYRVAGRMGFDLFRRSSDRLLKVFERLTGYDVLADLSDFFLAFAGMSAGFKERSQRVVTMLKQPETSFLLVCAPEPSSLSQVDRFFARLSKDAMPIGGVIINRVHQADAIFDESSYSLTPRRRRADCGGPNRHVGGAISRSACSRAYRDQLTLAALDRAAIDATDWARAEGSTAPGTALRSRSAQPRRRRGVFRVPAEGSVEDGHGADVAFRNRHRNRADRPFGSGST